MNRRSLLQGIIGGAAALILPPSLDENVEAARRYWSLDRTMSGSTLHVRYGHPWSPFALTREPERLRLVAHFPDGSTETHLLSSMPRIAEPIQVRLTRKDTITGAAIWGVEDNRLRITYGYVPFEAM